MTERRTFIRYWECESELGFERYLAVDQFEPLHSSDEVRRPPSKVGYFRFVVSVLALAPAVLMVLAAGMACLRLTGSQFVPEDIRLVVEICFGYMTSYFAGVRR